MESHFFFIQLKNTLENSGNSVNFVYSPLLFFTHFGSRVFHLPLRTIDKMLHILSRKDKVKNRSRKVTSQKTSLSSFFPLRLSHQSVFPKTDPSSFPLLYTTVDYITLSIILLFTCLLVLPNLPLCAFGHVGCNCI